MSMFTAPVVLPDSDIVPRLRWTRAQYHDLAQQGFIEEGSRYELVEGEIVERMTVNQPHVIACRRSARAVSHIFGEAFVQTQAPIAIDGLEGFNEPEPDVYVVRRPVEVFSTEPPQPSDVVLIVEVSDATLRKDLGVKAALYARAGISDYWVLNLNARRLIVHRSPNAGGYESVVTLTDSDTVTPLEAPDSAIAVADLLPI